MYLVFVVLAILVVFAVVAAVAGRVALLGDEADDAAQPVMPSGDLAADDLDQVRFTVAARGYRMDQVDDVITRLRAELAARDDRIATLEAGSGADAAAGAASTASRRPGWPDTSA